MDLRAGLRLLSTVLAVAGAISAEGAHTQARLLVGAEAARPGDTVLAGIHLHMEKGWHTYWRNPGQSGLPTTVTWQLPAGVSAGEIQWPVPKRMSESEQTTYIYENDVVLLVPLQIAQNAAHGPLNLKAKVEWLECNTKCINENANVEADMAFGAEEKASKNLAFLDGWKTRIPKPGDAAAPHAWWVGQPVGDLRPLNLEWNATVEVTEADFFPDASEKFEVQPTTERIEAPPGKIKLRAQITKLSGDWPKNISGLLIEKSRAESRAFAVKVPLTDSDARSALSSSAAASNVGSAGRSLGLIFLYAFLGGLLLNIMPCVLPVIALKILGFVNEARHEPKRVRNLGLIYTAGVLTSFLVLALIVLVLQAAGKAAGWGFQFANPYFLIIMTVLVTLIALNLFGVFEITLGSGAMTAATALASKQGSAGAFFNGLLTTLLATSCTAPFLAPAVGFASILTNRLLTVLILLTVGAGLAAPYLVLSYQPAWLKLLPKPGVWMQKFKIAMGFPMIAAAAWLCSIVAVHYGDRAWWMVMFLLFLAVAAWVYGEFVQRGRSRRGLAGSLCLILLIGGYAYALESKLDWRAPLTGTIAQTGPSKVAPKGLPWQSWSPEAVAEARAAGHPVVVDFTAKWCPTCNTIVKPSFENSAVQKRLKEVNATILVADYTLRPDNITAELKRFQRAGVPLVLIYPADLKEAPQVFDLVWPGTILSALNSAIQPSGVREEKTTEQVKLP